jgi:Na+/melibiose symporter-like transporter
MEGISASAKVAPVKWLTQPTRGRIALWAALAVLWLLFLPQDLANDPGHKHFSVVGAVIWAAVLVALLSCAFVTWRRHRREHNAEHR